MKQDSLEIQRTIDLRTKNLNTQKDLILNETNQFSRDLSQEEETFNLAISLLHSFEYEEAEKAFVQVIDVDPDCAMAY